MVVIHKVVRALAQELNLLSLLLAATEPGVSACAAIAEVCLSSVADT